MRSSNRLVLLAPILVVILSALACSAPGAPAAAQPTPTLMALPTSAGAGSGSDTSAGNPTPEPGGGGGASGVPDACAILTAGMIKDLLGLTVPDGAPQPSAMNGSTCKYKAASGGDSVILQIGSGQEYYLDISTAPGAKDGGIADKSWYQEPDVLSSANASALKGNIVVMLTAHGKGFTGAQLLAALKAVVDKL